jgi:hypothetical protein
VCEATGCDMATSALSAASFQHQQGSACVPAVLVAVTARTCKLAMFGWPEAQDRSTHQAREQETGALTGGTDGTAGERTMGDCREDAVLAVAGINDCESGSEHDPSCFSQQPMLLHQRVQMPTASRTEVPWMPVCWLPTTAGHSSGRKIIDTSSSVAKHATSYTCARHASAQEYESQGAAVDAQPGGTPPSHEVAVEPSSRMHATAEHAVPVTAAVLHDTCKGPLAWLLLGLPSGKMELCEVRVDKDAWRKGLSPIRGDTPKGEDRAAPNGSGASSWRSSSARVQQPSRSAVTGSNAGSWRKQSIMEVSVCKLNAPDVHQRMLFTLHASLSQVTDEDKWQWLAVSTSYDRKLVCWDLQITSSKSTAHMRPRHTWTGTGADVLAMHPYQVCVLMCSLATDSHCPVFPSNAAVLRRPLSCDLSQANPACIPMQLFFQAAMAGSSASHAVLVATGDKHMRRFWFSKLASFKDSSCKCSEEECELHRQDSEQVRVCLLSGAQDLFYQGMPSEVSVVDCLDALVAAGCKDGTIGLVDCSQSPAKAQLVTFPTKHEGAVVACALRKSRPLQTDVTGERATNSRGLCQLLLDVQIRGCSCAKLRAASPSSMPTVALCRG